MKGQQVSDFLVKNFSDVPYKWPLEAYGTRGSLRDVWRPAYAMHGSLRELAHLSHHCTMHDPKTLTRLLLNRGQTMRFLHGCVY